MQILTLDQILTDCNQVVNRAASYSFTGGFFFQTLQFTGCRIEELTNPTLWSKPLPNAINLQTLKRGGVRVFNPQDLPIPFINWFLGAPYAGSYMSKQNMRRIHNTFTMYPTAMVKDKQISVHIFRHAKIKWLHANYIPTATIANMFGYTDIETAQYYIDSTIYLP